MSEQGSERELIAAPANPSLDDLIAFYGENNFRSGVTVRVPYRATREALERLRSVLESPGTKPTDRRCRYCKGAMTDGICVDCDR